MISLLQALAFTVWEGILFRLSGFYINRICFDEMLKLLAGAGFVYALPRVLRREHLSVLRAEMVPKVKQLSDDIWCTGLCCFKKP